MEAKQPFLKMNVKIYWQDSIFKSDLITLTRFQKQVFAYLIKDNGIYFPKSVLNLIYQYLLYYWKFVQYLFLVADIVKLGTYWVCWNIVQLCENFLLLFVNKYAELA